MNKGAAGRLLKILEFERSALLAGDLDAIGELAQEKEALATSIKDLPRKDLKNISGALARNGVLLAAARDGVGDVLDKLRQQRSARSTLSSYDSSGKATTITQLPRGTERRF